MSDTPNEYINSTDFKDLGDKLNNLNSILSDLTAKALASRKQRYAVIDAEAERKAGRLAPDEMWVSLRVIDTNIRREQSSYIQFITQSPRAVVLRNKMDAAIDMAPLENDLTEKLRYDGWQLPAYANIDGFQAFGYGVMETVQDDEKPGEIAREYVQYGDFAFVADTRDIQKVEMVGRAYYFTKTKLNELKNLKGEDKWNEEYVKELLDSEPSDESTMLYSGTATYNRSLFRVVKVMFRVDGIVQVAWCAPKQCNGWLRNPRPLYLGRRVNHAGAQKFAKVVSRLPEPAVPMAMKMIQKIDPEVKQSHIDQMRDGMPASDAAYETNYPYFLYPYLISEDDTIAALKGRVYLDQDTQNAGSSLLTSTITQARRASMMLFAKDESDPNSNFLQEKNVQFKNGAIINGKLKEFHLEAPNPTMFQAINMLVASNQNETSQVNFAETNRQGDSRKTAAAIKAAGAQAQQLSSVQVTLYSIALKKQYSFEVDIIKSRVLAGFIKVRPDLIPYYQMDFTVKPSGDTDVIEKQQLIAQMQQSWEVYQNTPAAEIFLTDLTEKMFPEQAAKYVKAIREAAAAAKSQQAQQQQAMMQQVEQLGRQVVELSKHPEFFSETGRMHALPVVQQAAQKIEAALPK